MDLSRPLGIVTPTLDGDVLSILALADAPFTPGQLSRMLPSHSEDGIRRALRRLTSQGVVYADRAGNAYLYRLNRRHLGADPIEQIARMRQTLLFRLERRLESWEPPPVYGAIFGSAARNTMRTDSDIDILLVRPDDCDRERWDDRVAEMASDVAAWTGNDARVLEFGESELRTTAGDESVLVDIRAHGLTVAGTAAWLHRLLRSTGLSRAAD